MKSTGDPNYDEHAYPNVPSMCVSGGASPIGALSSSAATGCTDPGAPNFDPVAIIDDGSCKDPAAAATGAASEVRQLEHQPPPVICRDLPVTFRDLQ